MDKMVVTFTQPSTARSSRYIVSICLNSRYFSFFLMCLWLCLSLFGVFLPFFCSTTVYWRPIGLDIRICQSQLHWPRQYAFWTRALSLFILFFSLSLNPFSGTHTRAYTHTHSFSYTHIHAHTHIHTYTHSHTHTHTYFLVVIARDFVI
jgi:hypothetical protein